MPLVTPSPKKFLPSGLTFVPLRSRPLVLTTNPVLLSVTENPGDVHVNLFAGHFILLYIICAVRKFVHSRFEGV